MKLDIGCGNSKPEGFVGIDIRPTSAADIVCDITQHIPLPDGCAEEVRLSHVMEHIAECDAAIYEINRVCKPGAIIKIIVPDVQHETFHMPTHCQPWSRRWFHEHLKLWIVESIEEVPDAETIALARKYLPGITDEDAMTLLWNCRKELRVTCRRR